MKRKDSQSFAICAIPMAYTGHDRNMSFQDICHDTQDTKFSQRMRRLFGLKLKHELNYKSDFSEKRVGGMQAMAAPKVVWDHEDEERAHSVRQAISSR
nr:hypothetical protein BaRGS_019284 [Batillaria attramentaria]